MANTVLTINVTFGQKTIELTNQIAIRESVDVTIKNAAAYVGQGIVLAIMKNGTLFAQCNTWTVAGVTDALGTLDMNTSELIAAFNKAGPQAIKQFTVIAVVVSPSTVLFNGVIGIQNTPYEDGMNDPTSVTPWNSDVSAAVLARVDAFETQLNSIIGDEGYTIAAGATLRDVSEAMTIGQLLAFVRTLASDLHTKGII